MNFFIYECVSCDLSGCFAFAKAENVEAAMKIVERNFGEGYKWELDEVKPIKG